MLVSSGRRLDMSTPFVDALLPDGSRLHVVIPSITRQHWAINIRKFVARAFDLSGLVALGSLTPQAADFLDAAVGRSEERRAGKERRPRGCQGASTKQQKNSGS